MPVNTVIEIERIQKRARLVVEEEMKQGFVKEWTEGMEAAKAHWKTIAPPGKLGIRKIKK